MQVTFSQFHTGEVGAQLVTATHMPLSYASTMRLC